MTGSVVFRSATAAISAVCVILAGVLGGWLTVHWRSGVAFAFLIMIAIVAGSLVSRGVIAAISDVCAILASILGGRVTEHWQWGVATCAFLIIIVIVAAFEFRKTIGRTTSASVSVAGTVLAVLASLASAGGTLYYVHHMPEIISPEPAAVLAAAGGHDSPSAAVSGFIGDTLLAAYTGMCSYYLPTQQHLCLQHEPHGRAESGRAAIGEVIVNGTRAVVAVVGRICVLTATTQSRTSCLYNSSPYIGQGQDTTFTHAFNTATMASYRGMMWSCEEVRGAWYVAFTKPS